MKRLPMLLALVACAASPLFAAPQSAKAAADSPGASLIERLAAELLEPSPDVAKSIGDLAVEYHDSSIVNAYATRTRAGAPLLIFYDGIVAALDRDERLVRAVVAHELAHLHRGHIRELTRPRTPLIAFPDVRFHFVRQVEFDADEVGAQILESAGYSRNDLEQALLKLHDVHREYGVSWLEGISDDHGSWIERVARIVPSERRFQALAAFERGLAFVECRRPSQALLAFERALEIEPGLDEARFARVRALLQVYYENLPDAVRGEWLRPDFGPQLTLDDVFAVRGAAATAADRRRWSAVREAALELPRGFSPAHYELMLGTIDVLHPDGDASILGRGIQRLQTGMLNPAVARRHREPIRLALANNAALGLARIGDADGALGLLSAELEDQFAYARYLHVSNAARLTLVGVQLATSEVFVSLLQDALRSSRAGSERYTRARGALDRIGSSIGADLLESEAPSALQLCRPTRVEVEGIEVGLFAPIEEAVEALGAPAVDDRVHPDFDAFRVLAWRDAEGSADVIALVEEGRPLLIKSYRLGSAVLLEPADETDVRTLRIEVGASVDELEGLLERIDLPWDRIPGQPMLARAVVDGAAPAQREESWTYLPDLALGVLLEGGVVQGVAVTPTAP